MQYELHLNLRQRAALRIAISLWESKEIQNQVKALLQLYKFKIVTVKYEWNKLTKQVMDKWDKNILPQKLEIELIHIVKMIGEEIFNWYQYVNYEFGLEEAINCIDKICWTSYGTIDAVKIFKSYWLMNPNFHIIKLYNFACSHVLVEYINDLWDKIPKNIQDNSFHDIYYYVDKNILGYWQSCRDNDLDDLIGYFEDTDVFDLIYDLNRSTNENMFQLSIYQGYFIASKYFWKKLTEEEKNNCILNCARIAVMRYISYKNFFLPNIERIKDYKKNQYIEICIFLMNHMTNSHKRAFFNENLGLNDPHATFMDSLDVKNVVLEILLSAWPWQELYMLVLKDVLQYLDDNSEMEYRFLNLITKQMVENDYLDYPIEKSVYKNLLRNVWLILPASFKQKIVNTYHDITFICNLVKIWDIDSLKLILDDPDVEDVRYQYILGGRKIYEELVEKDQFERLDKFIEEIMHSEKDKKWFKGTVNAWFGLLLIDRLDLADKLLDWRCSTPEERRSVKSDIDHEAMCEYIIEDHKYELLDKFLDWKLETEEEKKNRKNYFKSDGYPIRRVFDIWTKNRINIKNAKEESTKFLKWLLESDEEMERFKKENSANFGTDEIHIIYLTELNRIGNMIEFLSWCLLSDEDIQQIREIVNRTRVAF